MLPIELAPLQAEIRRLALEFPDRVNPTDASYCGGTCFNFHRDGQPGCIVGHAVYNLGFHPPRIPFPQSAFSLRRLGVLDLEAGVWATLLQNFMDRQSSPRPWRDALETLPE